MVVIGFFAMANGQCNANGHGNAKAMRHHTAVLLNLVHNRHPGAHNYGYCLGGYQVLYYFRNLVC